jgi:hypothetical protein
LPKLRFDQDWRVGSLSHAALVVLLSLLQLLGGRGLWQYRAYQWCVMMLPWPYNIIQTGVWLTRRCAVFFAF